MNEFVEALFGVPWPQLGPEHVRAFLAEAGDEGITWEVKGDAKHHAWVRPEQVRKTASGFANSRGGVLIIGAERPDKKKPGWTIEGLAPPNEEIPLWLSRVMRHGLRPVPRFEIGPVWEVAEERWAAIVLVEPTPEPPCITSDGQIFQRTSGETITVTDPLVLGRLTEAGQAARRDAEAKTELIRSRLPVVHKFLPQASSLPPRRGTVLIAATAAGYEPDIASRLFHARFRDELRTAMVQNLRPEPSEQADPRQVQFGQAQNRVVARLGPMEAPGYDQWWTVLAEWTGSVMVVVRARQGQDLRRFEVNLLRPAWEVVNRALSALGPAGDQAFYSIDIYDMQLMVEGPQPATLNQTTGWYQLDRIPEEGRQRALDEIERAGGKQVWLGEDKDPAA